MLILPMPLVLVHFVGDFVLQNDWMSLNKSRRWWPLTAHVLVYSAPFLWWGWRFAAVTFVLHWLTDAVTSRLNTKLLAVGRGSSHWFFIGVGFDQVLHYAALAYVYAALAV